jgi:RNA polymerase sigma factor (TIGR02999 family)
MTGVTQILVSIERGDPHAAEQLLPLVYEELRNLAAARLAQENPGQTLQATALVHEAYVRLVHGQESRQWNGRTHFFRAAAEAMRCILVDAARQKQSLKRGGAFERIEFEALAERSAASASEVLGVHEALDKLAVLHPDKAELVKLRYFAGLTLQEAADVLGISRATADRHWGFARTWLYCEISRSSDSNPA